MSARSETATSSWNIAVSCDSDVRLSVMRLGLSEISIDPIAISTAVDTIADCAQLDLKPDIDLHLHVSPPKYPAFDYLGLLGPTMRYGTTQKSFDNNRTLFDIAINTINLQNPAELQKTAVHELAHCVSRSTIEPKGSVLRKARLHSYLGSMAADREAFARSTQASIYLELPPIIVTR